MDIAKELMVASYDMHVHTDPSHFPRAIDDFELLKEADAYQMKGVLIKSHYEPTQTRALIAAKHAQAKCNIYGALALNWPAGGLNVYAAESALKLGAVMIWMPTRDSENSLSYGDMPGDFFSRPPISIYDEMGKIKKEVFLIIETVKKYDAYLCTGHLNIKESFDLCQAAGAMGAKTILTHPDWIRTTIPFETQKQFAQNGTLIEKVWENICSGYITPAEMAYSINLIGAENIFMVTDCSQAHQAHPALEMQKFIASLLSVGIRSEQIAIMIRTVPEEKILGSSR